ncbi:MAG: signal peptidase I [Verrucomicrobia bacterium]|nr:signal peptidase I [Verrucomicrobiota bacterium]
MKSRPTSSEPSTPGTRRTRRLRRLMSLCAATVVLGFLAARYRLVWVVGDSMRPAYRPGNVLLVDRWAYSRQTPRRWDVVVASHHGDWVVKRVVGLPGDRVGVRHGHVLLNGIRIQEPQITEPGMLSIESGQLLGDRYAILGDNRGIPEDSFVHAVVQRQQLVGRVVSALRPLHGIRGMAAGVAGWFSTP